MPQTPAANLAIYYHPDGYETKNRPLMGRRAAGKSFLDAWFARRGDGDLYCCAGRRADFEQFVEHAKSRDVRGKAHWLRLDQLETVAQAGTLYYPGPDIALNAWRRHKRDPRGFSIVGVTHTICTKAVMDGITEWLTSPVESWDAVICTSNAVRESVGYVLKQESEFLARRNGATRFPAPQLPVIPLGIDTRQFAADEAMREATRRKLGIAGDDIAFLFVGRLSIYGKAHPVPMFVALERAARATAKTLHVILAGWFATKGIEQAFDAFARQYCPSVRVHVVDGRDDTARNGAWRAGDIFVSLVDNIQETFGLTPVEAMAAGMPCVVSDWDGYRETVRHGIDGFRIPTLQASAPFGEAMMDRYAADIDSYDTYLARSTYNVVVDVDAAAGAFAALIDDPHLRRRMGDAGRIRARSEFDWPVILQKYEALAADLAERRKAAPAPAAKVRRVWPARLSPTEMFANYPTRGLQSDDRIRCIADDIEQGVAAIAAEANTALDNRQRLIASARALLAKLGKDEHKLSSLLDAFEPAGRAALVSLILRLTKFGLLSISPASGAKGPRKGPADTGA